MTKKILAISGSLRALSSNTQILKCAQRLAPKNIEVQLFSEIGDLPPYNPDLDQDPRPIAVQKFRERVEEADAILISTPEYVHGIPGVLKNALDWLVSDEIIAAKSIGVILASSTDSEYLKPALLEVLKTMSSRVVMNPILNLSGVRKRLDSDGNFVQTKDQEQMLKLLQELIQC